MQRRFIRSPYVLTGRCLPLSLVMVTLAGLFAATPQGLSQDVVRFSQDAALKAATNKPAPQYPPVARQLKLTGDTQLDVWVDLTGKVEKVEIVKGNPILANAAAAALKDWEFTPFKANGSATRAVVRMAFHFAP